MTEIVCKCGTSRLEDVQCAECGEYFRAGWIPVNERLPEFEEYPVSVDVLVYWLGNVDVGWYDHAHKKWICSNQLVDIISHWMPLPPPPEDE